MAELLAVLYSGVLRIDPSRPNWKDRDRFILSKGHACAGLYAVLAEREFFPRAWLDGFYQDGARLYGHITHSGIPGVEYRPPLSTMVYVGLAGIVLGLIASILPARRAARLDVIRAISYE